MEPKIGVYICHCGANIAGTVDVTKVVDYAKGLPAVAIARDYKFMCSDPGQDLIKNDIRDQGLNRVMLAATARADLSAGAGGGRTKPVSLRDGQYPRAMRLGAYR
jgi:hypothetical protein